MKEMESKFDQRMTKLESKNMQLVDKVMQQDHTIIKYKSKVKQLEVQMQD